MSATFTCSVNSHPFQERRVLLLEPAKIGRSVARARPAANNAVFDCKVLSRNHALLWYEDGKFYVKDTKSSNGTFVNNQRLSKGAEESLPFKVNSGDVVQFGVDVVENSRRVTHGCIVSQIRLYLPNGEEAQQSDASITSHLLDKVSHNIARPLMQSQDLYQLHQYLQEALHREQMLEQKLALLQRLVLDSHETSEKGWQALIDEDKLLSRLEFLENQLQTSDKTLSEESVQKELLQLQEEKHNYETTSKETLRQVLGEKLEAQQKLGNLERSYSNSEDECMHLRDVLSKTQKDLKDLTEKYQTLRDKAQEAETLWLEEKKKAIQVNKDLTNRIQRFEETEKDLRQRLENAAANIDKQEVEMNNFKSQLANTENTKMSLTTETSAKDLLIPEQVINGSANLKDKLNDILCNQGDIARTDIKVSLKEDDIEVVKTIEFYEKPSEEKMNVISIPLANNDAIVPATIANRKVAETDGDMRDKIAMTKLEARIAELEILVENSSASLKQEESRRLDLEMELDQIQEARDVEKKMLAETTRELQVALGERESLLDEEKRLKVRVEESEKLLEACETDSLSSSSEVEEVGQGDEEDNLTCGSLHIAKAKLKELKKKLKEKESQLVDAQAKLEIAVDYSVAKNLNEADGSKSTFGKSEERIKYLEAELSSLRHSSEKCSKLEAELEEARQLARTQCQLYEAAQQKIELSSKSNIEFQEIKERLEKEKEEKENCAKELKTLLSSSNQQQENLESLVKEKSELKESIKQYVNEISSLKQCQKDSVELASKNEKLAEEKEDIMKIMQSLTDKLDRQQAEGLDDDSAFHREQEMEERLAAKQEEIDSTNLKLSDLLDEQQKLLTKISQQSENDDRLGNALVAVVLAFFFGIICLLWHSG